MDKAKALLDLFRTGSALADPAVWQKRAAAVLALSAFLMGGSYALKAFFGIDLGLTNDDANAIAGGVVTLVGLFIALATRKDVGVLPPKVGDKDTSTGEQNAGPQVQTDGKSTDDGHVAMHEGGQ